MDSVTLEKIEFPAVLRVIQRYCACMLGKDRVARIVPARDLDAAVRSLKETSQMVAAIRDVALPPMAGVTDIRDALMRIKPGGGADPEDFAAVAAVLEAAGAVRKFLGGLDENLHLLRAMGEQIATFDAEVAAVRAVLESDARVRDDASHALHRLRHEIETVTKGIHDLIYGYLRNREVAKLLQDVNVTLHGDRYVLPVKSENRGRLPGVVHRASNTGATVFVEPAECVELNNKLSDLIVDERKEVHRLLTELALKIAPRAAEIVDTLGALAEVDALAAKAQYAYEFDLTCPDLTDRGGLQLFDARHPLLIEQAYQQAKGGAAATAHKVVPIDIRLGKEFDILVITGSNTGGKTVTLKTVALLAAMAQAGIHIPAQRGAKLCLFRDVFIDVGDEQSLQQSLSTFGGHVERLRMILKRADDHSLVLLDELGSGTDPDEGGAIGQAVLDELGRIGCLAMVSTHLSVLKAYALNHDRVDNASVEFNTATLSPMYRLHIGTAGQSHAITVAEKLGLPRRIIDGARGYLGEQHKQFVRAMRITGEVRRSAEEAKVEAHRAKLSAEQQQEVYEGKLSDLKELQEQFTGWLAALAEMKPGDEVFVPSAQRTGTLARMEFHRQIAVVDCDNLQIEVPLRELMPDLGQTGAREQMAAMKGQMAQQAKEAEDAARRAKDALAEQQKLLEYQKAKAAQFDRWIGSIGRMRVGTEVPIARKPGKALLVRADLPGLRAFVLIEEKEVSIPLSDLFPQAGPFAPRHQERTEGEGRREHRERHGRREGQGRPQGTPEGEKTEATRSRERHGGHEKHGTHEGQRRHEKKEDKSQPMHRRAADSKDAQAAMEILRKSKPGQKVYVVPFNKRATIVRLNLEKDTAVVLSGIFELEVPLSDLEPLREE
ncbi:MAG: hypothetical protein NTV86_01840 [Planctomycetota bacterium]|nr:hypothetical protein [Planctomycetota bacterium]